MGEKVSASWRYRIDWLLENQEQIRNIAGLEREGRSLAKQNSASRREIARLKSVNGHNAELIERLNRKLDSPLKLVEALSCVFTSTSLRFI